MAQNLLRNERGTTLIQALGAVVILTAIVLSFVGIAQFTAASNKDTDNRNKALFIAEEMINNYRSGTTYVIGTETPTSEAGFNYIINRVALPAANTSITLPAIASRYQVSLQALIRSGTSTSPNLVSVTVSWGG
ncbi:hypothetical protein K0T92_03640 [Paenibacillus oenotherae]|uniref:Uncharacterized protein n=1 Tax=Paenibacillus oenotherae TaxID=1435645 RepID=A0ABS7D1S0_9BACL|nr:hypothetical protein [Paenibacillus oenotherae]MBW7473835.1 hypothetical protein [Paenibacillus oenotherae]